MTQAGGDKELVIGNKQLISLFFVVVALCGVFFAMGYMIGRNSAKTTLTDSGTASSGVNTASTGQKPETPRETIVPPDTSAQAQTPPAETHPVADAGQAAARPEPPAAKAEEMKPAPAPAPYSSASKVSAPEVGASYLQVTALPRPDADAVVKTLRDQTFPTILATSSKEGLFRVLVGPFHQTAELADAKARLKTIGFGSAFVQKQ